MLWLSLPCIAYHQTHHGAPYTHVPSPNINTHQVSATAIYDTYATGITPRVPRAMAVDGVGAAYAAGFFTSSVFFVRGRPFSNRGKADAWVGKLDPAGQVLWVQTMGGAEADEGRAIALAGDSVFVAGVFQSPSMTAGPFALAATSTAAPDVFVARLNATTGDVLWARAFGGEGAEGVASVVVANGLVYLAGVFHSPALQFDAETVLNAHASADGGGGTVFVATLAAGTGAVAKAEALPALWTLSRMELDRRTGAVFLVGTDYVARVGAWRTSLEGSSVTDPRRGLALDPSSRRLFVAAPFNASSITLEGPSSSGVVLENAGAGFDSYVACLDTATGDVQWARRIGGGRNDVVVGLAEDAATGGVYAAGTFEGQLSSLPAPWELTAAGSAADAFLVRYDGEGGVRGAWRFGSSAAESVNDVAVDRLGGVYLTGRTDGTAQFGRQNVTQQFIARAATVCFCTLVYMYMCV